jgi:hypothetical protein
LEKAWAKINGNYYNMSGGYSQETLRALLGVPVYSYKLENLYLPGPGFGWDIWGTLWDMK